MLARLLDAQPEIGVVYGKGQAMDREGRALDHAQGMSQRFPGDDLRSIVYDDHTWNVALMARRECFDRAGFYDEGRWSPTKIGTCGFEWLATIVSVLSTRFSLVWWHDSKISPGRCRPALPKS